MSKIRLNKNEVSTIITLCNDRIYQAGKNIKQFTNKALILATKDEIKTLKTIIKKINLIYQYE